MWGPVDVFLTDPIFIFYFNVKQEIGNQKVLPYIAVLDEWQLDLLIVYLLCTQNLTR